MYLFSVPVLYLLVANNPKPSPASWANSSTVLGHTLKSRAGAWLSVGTVNTLSFWCAHFWVNVSWPLSASFLFLGASPVCVLQAFKGPAKGQSLSPSSSYRILVIEYHSGLGMSIHQPISVACREAHTDWSDLVYGSTLRSWEISVNLLKPRRLREGSGHFPKEKSGCCYQRKRSEDDSRPKHGYPLPCAPWILIVPSLDLENLLPAGVSVSRPELLAALGLISLTASAHLSLLPCSHDTAVFPPEVGVNGLPHATINGIL